MPKERSDNTNYKMKMFGENIFYLSYLDEADVDLEKVQEIVHQGFELHGEKPFYSIIDFRDRFASMTPDAKKYLAEQKLLNELRICEAILVNTLAMKLIVSGYFRLYKPAWPLKVFRKDAELYAWLISHNASSNDLQDLKHYLENKKVPTL